MESFFVKAGDRTAVKWRPWGAAAFAEAVRMDRPMLVAVGARWSHACRVMDAGTYADAAVAKAVAAGFVAVRVDRDERPDVDERLQVAYSAINRRPGGYPLTVFMMPDGRVLEALAFVPAATTGQRTGMRDSLAQVDKLWRGDRAAVEKTARAIADGVKATLPSAAGMAPAADRALADRLAASLVSALEPATGAFGATGKPRAPGPAGALALLQRASDLGAGPAGGQTAAEQAAKSLKATFLSGLRDNVHGGYFRMSSDDATARPRFEKLLTVQAEMLRAQTAAYAATRRSLHKEAAEDVLRCVRSTFAPETAGPAAGLFPASQDADGAAAADDGRHYTWTFDEVTGTAVEELDGQVFARHFNIADDGARHAPRPTAPLQATADELKIERDDAEKRLRAARTRLMEARVRAGTAPPVERAVIGAWNAAMATAMLDAARHLGDEAAGAMALKAIDSQVERMMDPDRGAARVLRPGAAVATGFGFLEDNVRLAEACLAAFEYRGRASDLATARTLMVGVEAGWLDGTTGLYVSRRVGSAAGAGSDETADPAVLSVVDQGAGGSNANALAAIVWYRLYQAGGDKSDRARAERLVAAGAAQPGVAGVAAATWARAAAVVAFGPPKAVVIAAEGDPAGAALRKALLASPRMGTLIEPMTPEEAAKTDYKPPKDGGAIVYVCTPSTCAPPARTPEDATKLLESFGRETVE